MGDPFQMILATVNKLNKKSLNPWDTTLPVVDVSQKMIDKFVTIFSCENQLILYTNLD